MIDAVKLSEPKSEVTLLLKKKLLARAAQDQPSQRIRPQERGNVLLNLKGKGKGKGKYPGPDEEPKGQGRWVYRPEKGESQKGKKGSTEKGKSKGKHYSKGKGQK